MATSTKANSELAVPAQGTGKLTYAHGADIPTRAAFAEVTAPASEEAQRHAHSPQAPAWKPTQGLLGLAGSIDWGMGKDEPTPTDSVLREGKFSRIDPGRRVRARSPIPTGLQNLCKDHGSLASFEKGERRATYPNGINEAGSKMPAMMVRADGLLRRRIKYDGSWKDVPGVATAWHGDLSRWHQSYTGTFADGLRDATGKITCPDGYHLLTAVSAERIRRARAPATYPNGRISTKGSFEAAKRRGPMAPMRIEDGRGSHGHVV